MALRCMTSTRHGLARTFSLPSGACATTNSMVRVMHAPARVVAVAASHAPGAKSSADSEGAVSALETGLACDSADVEEFKMAISPAVDKLEALCRTMASAFEEREKEHEDLKTEHRQLKRALAAEIEALKEALRQPAATADVGGMHKARGPINANKPPAMKKPHVQILLVNKGNWAFAPLLNSLDGPGIYTFYFCGPECDPEEAGTAWEPLQPKVYISNRRGPGLRSDGYPDDVWYPTDNPVIVPTAHGAGSVMQHLEYIKIVVQSFSPHAVRDGGKATSFIKDVIKQKCSVRVCVALDQWT